MPFPVCLTASRPSPRPPAHWHHGVALTAAGYELFNEIRPAPQGVTPFADVIVSLVNANDAAKGAATVIECRLDNLDGHAEPLHTGCGGSPDVMQGPRDSRLHCLIEVAFQPAEPTDRAASVIGEDEVTASEPRLCRYDGPRLWRQRHRVSDPVLGALARQPPEHVRGVDLAPRCSEDLAQPAAG